MVLGGNISRDQSYRNAQPAMLSATLNNARDTAAAFFQRRQTARRGMYRLLSSDDKLDLRCVVPNSAAQRTFDGAYVRTALGEMGFSLTVMRLFQREFFWVGLACCVQALCLLITAVFRYELSLRYENEFLQAAMQKLSAKGDTTIQSCSVDNNAHDTGNIQAEQTRTSANHNMRKRSITQLRTDTDDMRSGGRAPEHSPAPGSDCQILLLSRFWTAGYVVLFAATMTIAVEIAIIVLLARM